MERTVFLTSQFYISPPKRVMKDTQVQTQLSHRRSKSVADQAKKSHKISKNLSYAFDSASKHSPSFGTLADVSESNPDKAVSDVTETNQDKESMKTEAPAMSPSLSISSSSSEKPSPLSSDLTQLSTLSTADETRVYIYGTGGDTARSSYPLIFASPEAELVVNTLKRARAEVLSSVDLDLHLKKLLNSLLMISIEELYPVVPEERENYRNLSLGVRIAAICTMCLMISLLLLDFNFSGRESPYYPPPT